MMDIVKRLKQEFSDNALKDIADQTRVYVKERHEAADEIERLREALRLERQLKDDALRAFNEARAVLKDNP